MFEERLTQPSRDPIQDAAAERLTRLQPTLRAHLAGRIPKRWQAVLSVDDVLQHALVAAFLAIQDCAFADDAALAGWLRRLADNSLIDAVRELEAAKRGGDRRRITNEIPEQRFESFLGQILSAGGSATPSQSMARGETSALLRQMLRRLPDEYRMAVEMHDLEGKSIAEIAARMERSEGSVHMLRLRAHRRLREIMAGQTTIFRAFS